MGRCKKWLFFTNTYLGKKKTAFFFKCIIVKIPRFYRKKAAFLQKYLEEIHELSVSFLSVFRRCVKFKKLLPCSSVAFCCPPVFIFLFSAWNTINAQIKLKGVWVWHGSTAYNSIRKDKQQEINWTHLAFCRHFVEIPVWVASVELLYMEVQHIIQLEKINNKKLIEPTLLSVDILSRYQFELLQPTFKTLNLRCIWIKSVLHGWTNIWIYAALFSKINKPN